MKGRCLNRLTMEPLIYYMSRLRKISQNRKTPRVGLEPTTTRLTAECSTIELSRIIFLKADTFKTVYRLQISLCIITSSRCFLQPASRFFWISLRPISDSQLHALPHFHLCPIYLIVSKGSYVITHGISHLKGGFTLRCLQRLSLPNLATRLCHWCDNR